MKNWFTAFCLMLATGGCYGYARAGAYGSAGFPPYQPGFAPLRPLATPPAAAYGFVSPYGYLPPPSYYAYGRSVYSGGVYDPRAAGAYRPAAMSAQTAPNVAATQPLPSSTRCMTSLVNGVHVRPREVMASIGTEYPPGTEVEILGVGMLVRGGEAIRRIRVVENGAEGWAFLTRTELASCGLPVAHTADASTRAALETALRVNAENVRLEAENAQRRMHH